MSNTVAILNQKGGVGKTTLALGLASAAWAGRTRMLVVDLDAQANATWALGVDPSSNYLGTGDALDGDLSVCSGFTCPPGGGFSSTVQFDRPSAASSAGGRSTK